MSRLRKTPPGWKHAPSYAGGQAFTWAAKPADETRTWVAFPGPRGGWLVKDKTPGVVDPAVHSLVTLEGFEEIAREVQPV